MKSNRAFLYGLIASAMPPTRGFAIRRHLLRWVGATVGDGASLVASARFMVGGDLIIGAKTWVGHGVLMIGGEASIRIGSHCDIAPRVMLVTGSHVIDLEGNRVAGVGISSPISIGDGCWIGAGATILGGTEIGTQSVVAAGAVVSGRFPPFSLIGGVPGRLIRELQREAMEGHVQSEVPASRIESRRTS